MSTSKSETKEKIKKLVERYKQVKKSHQRKTYDEANTRKDFVMPLFQALGWDIHSEVIKREVVEEATAVKGKVDYSFQINNIPKFLLEAKALKIDLEKPEWAEQAVTYGWNKGIPWVVLSNFEKLKVFNSDWKVDKPRPNINLSYEDYIEKFNLLWLLSKEASEANELDKLLSQFGITAKRVNVNEKLADDLTRWRNILTNNLSQWNTKIKLPDIEEAVQRILDRLIFIRVVEDREIEGKILWQTFQKWETDSRQSYNFIETLVPVFRDFDKKYNSNLFLPHLCEKLKTEGDPFHKIIPELYGNKEAGVKYRFDAIGADVLGSVYEQYLGYVQQRQGTKSKRKKQGIYYTPAYIVDYIVQNTLGAFLKKATLQEAANIKILDPACGSGSFLIRAFEVLDAHLKVEKAQRNAGSTIDALRKYDILTQNIYGVDLDSQAIEIARLNLMLKALVPGHRLPLLTEHMRVGNSLISGTEKELKKYFGNDYQNKKPFNWNEEFAGVLDKGSFDVIIGNPPYIFARSESFSSAEKNYFSGKYKLTHYQLHTFSLFIEKAFQLLKNGGWLGFIIPNNWLTIDTLLDLRKFILENTASVQVVNIFDNVFEDASVDTCLLLFQKSAPTKVTLGEFSEGTLKIHGEFSTSFFKKNNYIINISLAKSKNRTSILEKIQVESKILKKYATVKSGLKAYEVGKGQPPQTEEMKDERVYHTKTKLDNTHLRYLEGRGVSRYKISWRGQWLKYGECLAAQRKFTLFTSPRILVRQIPSPPPYSINAVYTDKVYLNDINSMVVFDFKDDPLFLLAVLNSRLTTFWFINTFDKFQRKTFPQFKVKELASFPIPNASKEKKKDLAAKTRLIMKLYEGLKKTNENTNGYQKVEQEINKVDREIDQTVYRFYNLTPKEIEIVENNSK